MLRPLCWVADNYSWMRGLKKSKHLLRCVQPSAKAYDYCRNILIWFVALWHTIHSLPVCSNCDIFCNVETNNHSSSWHLGTGSVQAKNSRSNWPTSAWIVGHLGVHFFILTVQMSAASVYSGSDQQMPYVQVQNDLYREDQQPIPTVTGFRQNVMQAAPEPAHTGHQPQPMVVICTCDSNTHTHTHVSKQVTTNCCNCKLEVLNQCYCTGCN